MSALNSLPDEMLGFFILVSGALAKLLRPEIGDFWLALATALTLFLVMHVRSRSIFMATPKETPTPSP
jgi:hypothetical protein